MTSGDIFPGKYFFYTTMFSKIHRIQPHNNSFYAKYDVINMISS